MVTQGVTPPLDQDLAGIRQKVASITTKVRLRIVNISSKAADIVLAIAQSPSLQLYPYNLRSQVLGLRVSGICFEL